VRVRFARAALTFAVTAPLVYLAQRLFERWQGGVGDPLGIVREAHTAFYWRSATALWLAIALAALAARPVRGEAGHPFAIAAGWTALVLALAALYP
jgi:hypothetical protein